MRLFVTIDESIVDLGRQARVEKRTGHSNEMSLLALIADKM